MADAGRPVSIAELAERLDVHRSSAYRVLRTLEEHRFVLRDTTGLIRLGPRLAAIARGASSTLHSAALPILADVSNNLLMTTFISVLDGNEAITLVSVEPSLGHATVAQRPGAKHPITRGAPGHAIETLLSVPEHKSILGGSGRTRGARETARQGFAVSHDEVIKGLTSVAIPLEIPNEPPAALAVVTIGMPGNLAAVVSQLHRAAARLRLALGQG
jgi:DNA-binding IclR family transcriptional regulator